jgi:undecaprenyl-diphosphatase
MNIFYSLGLGILQGVTEFLPVSSSGHLAIIQSLLPHFSQPGVLFDVILHFGTMFSILFFFRKEIFKLPLKYYLFIAVGTIPAVFVGYFLGNAIENVFRGFRLVGFALLLTGVMNLLTDRLSQKGKNLNLRNSFVVGILQALAIVPGISRSGSTIFAGVFQGIDRKSAAQFSFLLSIPAVFGANVLEIAKYGFLPGLDLPFYLTGFLAAALSGYLAINAVFKIIALRKFRIFAFYCFALGAFAVIL